MRESPRRNRHDLCLNLAEAAQQSALKGEKNMTLYRSRTSQPLKWIVALFVFALVMGVTFSDVYGQDHHNGGKPGDNNFHGDRGKNDDHNGGHYGNNGGNGGGNNGDHGNGGGGDNGGNGGNDNPAPSSVPEPGTLILLAGGLSALYVARRNKSVK